MKKRLFVLLLAAVTAFSAVSLAGCGKKENGIAPVDDSASETVYTPTFMYFVSNADADYEAALAAAAELEEEYGERVKFDIHNIDETPEDKDNFPVEGATPALIMLNTKNDISSFQFKCADKETLKNDIETALAGE